MSTLEKVLRHLAHYYGGRAAAAGDAVTVALEDGRTLRAWNDPEHGWSVSTDAATSSLDLADESAGAVAYAVTLVVEGIDSLHRERRRQAGRVARP